MRTILYKPYKNFLNLIILGTQDLIYPKSDLRILIDSHSRRQISNSYEQHVSSDTASMIDQAIVDHENASMIGTSPAATVNDDISEDILSDMLERIKFRPLGKFFGWVHFIVLIFKIRKIF